MCVCVCVYTHIHIGIALLYIHFLSDALNIFCLEWSLYSRCRLMTLKTLRVHDSVMISGEVDFNLMHSFVFIFMKVIYVDV